MNKGDCFMIERCAAMFIQSLIPSLLFLFAGYLSCEGAVAWLIASAVYAAVQFVLLNAETVRLIITKIILTVLCESALQYFGLRFGWFYHIFRYYHPAYSAPNAGTGFAVLASYLFNAVLFLVIAVFLLVKTLAEQSSKHDQKC